MKRYRVEVWETVRHLTYEEAPSARAAKEQVRATWHRGSGVLRVVIKDVSVER